MVFVSLVDIGKCPANSRVDVIGVCKYVSETKTLKAKATGMPLFKKELLLVDQSGAGVTISLWGKQAQTFCVPENTVIAIQNGAVNEYRQLKSINVNFYTTVTSNPDIPQTKDLQDWFNSVDAHQHITVLADEDCLPWMTLSEAEKAGLGTNDKIDYFMCKATIFGIDFQNSLYEACPTPGCRKKVMTIMEGTYHCGKCNENYPNFIYCSRLLIIVRDWTGEGKVTCFSDLAERILNVTCKELGELQEDPGKFLEVFSAVYLRTYFFKLQAKSETYKNETEVKMTVMDLVPLHHVRHNRRMIEKIKNLSGNPSIPHQEAETSSSDMDSSEP